MTAAGSGAAEELSFQHHRLKLQLSTTLFVQHHCAAKSGAILLSSLFNLGIIMQAGRI